MWSWSATFSSQRTCIFILVIALLVLGPKRLPEVGRSLGRGLRDFKSAISGEEPDRPDEIVSHPPAASSPPPPTYQVEPSGHAEPVVDIQPVVVSAVQHLDDPQPVREHAEHPS